MDKGAWWATDHRVTRVGHNLVTTPPPPTHPHGGAVCRDQRGIGRKSSPVFIGTGTLSV